MFGEYFRRMVFWTLDFLKGSCVRKHYLDIKRRMDCNAAPEENLCSIMEYAIQNVPYYSNKDEDIIHFPVMNKEMYNANI